MKAYFYQDPMSDPLMQTIRLVLVEDRMGNRSYLGEDNLWHEVVEGAVAYPVKSGIVLPAGSVEAIAEAVDQHLGKAAHSNTEVRVLREWLAVEQRRVERVLGGAS